ncbi:hypothetical protein NDU88_007033 [Pleurodeles waltl]|uniref:Uncharacterized protein n=1 Tax=Pleurodeles waltl TaxID=8319 RepID=A0AAV7SRB7_PLEWA|nr:hypothetical protein NDU88_007033 [Pleurodeles waltl]
MSNILHSASEGSSHEYTCWVAHGVTPPHASREAAQRSLQVLSPGQTWSAANARRTRLRRAHTSTSVTHPAHRGEANLCNRHIQAPAPGRTPREP